jgi:hypothetical protein
MFTMASIQKTECISTPLFSQPDVRHHYEIGVTYRVVVDPDVVVGVVVVD